MAPPEIGPRVGMIGHGFMGAAHSQGWRTAPRFFDLAARPTMDVLVGRNADDVRAAASKWGWAQTDTDWRRVIERDDIDVIDIVSPGNTHAEIAIAALEAGKHVLCEKPLANTVEEAEAMAYAAARAAENGVFAMVGFTYRRVPAIALARDLVAAGRIGDIHQIRASYRQDWLADHDAPMSWRLDRTSAGSGALGDIGAHAIDTAQFISGQRMTSVSGTLQTVVTRRPVVAGGHGLSHGSSESSQAPESSRVPKSYGDVTVDDIAIFTGRFESGALGTFEASRMATGRKNALSIELSGSTGALRFDLEELNVLQFFDGTVAGPEQGFTRILVTEPEHPYIGAWWPAGHMLGYEHGFSHQVRDFVDAISCRHQPSPSFDDGLHLQRLLGAVELSAASGSAWVHADTLTSVPEMR